jgi:hypothetical protein
VVGVAPAAGGAEDAAAAAGEPVLLVVVVAVAAALAVGVAFAVAGVLPSCWDSRLGPVAVGPAGLGAAAASQPAEIEPGAGTLVAPVPAGLPQGEAPTGRAAAAADGGGTAAPG